MSILLEHHDVNKARRAMLVSAVAVVVLEYVTLSSDYIEILKLKINVNLPNLIIAGKISVVYLTFVFLWRVSISISEERQKSFEKIYTTGYKDIQMKLAQEETEFLSSSREGEELKNHYYDKIHNHIAPALYDFSNYLKRQVRSRAFVVDVYLPVLISVVAVTGAHGLVLPRVLVLP